MGKEVFTAVIAAAVVGLLAIWWKKSQLAQARAAAAPAAGSSSVARSYLNTSGSPDVVRGTPNVTPSYEAQWLQSGQLAIDEQRYNAESDFWA